MKGEGFYDRNSSPQWASIEAVLPWLKTAVSQMSLPDSGAPVTLIDYACSEGRNSIAMVEQIIPLLRQRTTRPIQVFHSDLPTNNFNKLFVNLASGDRAFSSGDGVYSAAVAGSMFDQLMPPQSVTIAMTFNAIGFLDHRPDVELPDYILPMGPRHPRPGVDVSPDARAAYKAQAADDLVRFYRARAAELVPGGKLLVASFGVNERYRCSDGIYDLLNDALLDVREAGRLSRVAYGRIVFPIYFRSKEELVAPVAGEGSPCSGCFQVDRVDSMEVPDVLGKQVGGTGDPITYAEEFTGFVRAFSEPILQSSLASQPDAHSVIEDVYQRMRDRMIANRTEYEFHYIQVAALLTRL
jgi:hypothetical protein